MPAGRAGHQQRLALRGRQMEDLRDDRADRAAGHDDRPFGAERPARADRDRRRERLEDRHLRLTSGSGRSGSPRSPRECRGRGCAPSRSAPSGR